MAASEFVIKQSHEKGFLLLLILAVLCFVSPLLDIVSPNFVVLLFSFLAANLDIKIKKVNDFNAHLLSANFDIKKISAGMKTKASTSNSLQCDHYSRRLCKIFGKANVKLTVFTPLKVSQNNVMPCAEASCFWVAKSTAVEFNK